MGTDGKPVIHNVPMYRSTDLVHWDYAGDAFPSKPAWVKPDAGMWAPDVIFHGGQLPDVLRRLGHHAARRRLGGRPGNQRLSDRAMDTTPAPRSSLRPRPSDPGSRRWEFDPEVIYAGGHAYLYFGSYFGGVFARELTPDGPARSPRGDADRDRQPVRGHATSSDTRLVLLHGLGDELLQRPTDGLRRLHRAIAQPARPVRGSRRTLDLEAGVGGTPVLAQNGNRWVGTGHNAVLTDYTGQEWILYHAVDRNDPYYAGDVGYTKRPRCSIHWTGGRAGQSSAAARGRRTAACPVRPRNRASAPATARTSLAATPSRPAGDRALSRRLRAARRWPDGGRWVRPPAADSYGSRNGKLHWQTQAGDLHPETPAAPLASVLTERAPRGNYIVETKVRVDVPEPAAARTTCRADWYLRRRRKLRQVASVSIFNTRQTEFGKEMTPQPAGYPNYGNTVVGPVGRLDVPAHRRFAATG